jgi:hypothetical protein
VAVRAISGDELAGHAAGLVEVAAGLVEVAAGLVERAAGDAHGVGLDVVARLRRLQQLADLLVGEALVGQASDRRAQLAAPCGAGGRHAHLLVPGQEHRRALEIGDQACRQLVRGDEAYRARSGQFGDAGLEVAAAGAQPIDLVAYGTQRRVLGAAVATAGHREGVGPARQVLAQRGGGLLELGTKLLRHPIRISRPAAFLRRTLRAVLRLTGLPAPARYPRATVRRAAERIEIVFSGEEGATRIDVDLRLLGPVEDLEAVVLDLLAKLQAQGYDARLDRRAP